MCTLHTGKLCYHAININYVLVLVLMCRIARELNLSSVMVLLTEFVVSSYRYSYAQLCMLTKDKSTKL